MMHTLGISLIICASFCIVAGMLALENASKKPRAEVEEWVAVIVLLAMSVVQTVGGLALLAQR